MRNNKKVYIIAEAGVNHNGHVPQALRLVDLAKAAGADAIKFQTFNADKVVTTYALKASYQGKGNQLEMLRRLELDKKAHLRIMARCRQRKIDFLSTSFDNDSVDLLRSLGLKTYKIPSGEITNVPYLRKVASVAKEVILSTGMSTLKEIVFAIKVMVREGFNKEHLTVLQCNTQYPTPPEDVNLKAMVTIKERLKVRVGYSDHTMGMEAAWAAVALGAQIIEKHFTADRSQKGPDHKASMEPDEFKAMVRGIRDIERMLGDGLKRPSLSEKKNIVAVRRSIVARRDIRKGELLTAENLTTKRPATGLSPVFWDQAIGKQAKRNFMMDEGIIL